MNSLVEKIMNADKAIRELYSAIIEILNQEDMDYKIEFQDKVWDFCHPLTRQEFYWMQEQRRQVADVFLKDAFDKLSIVLAGPIDPRYKDDDDLLYTWVNIANLQRYTNKSETISTIASEVPYEVDEETSKPLDYDSIYVQAQRKDLSDEDKWSILLRGMLDKESIQSTNE